MDLLNITITVQDPEGSSAITLRSVGHPSECFLEINPPDGELASVRVKAVHLLKLREAIDMMDLIPRNHIGD